MLRDFDNIMGNINPFDYDIKEKINEGAGTNVYRGIEKKTLKEYALVFGFQEKEHLKRYIHTLMHIKEIDLIGTVKLYGYRIYSISSIDSKLESLFKDDIYYGNPKSYFYLIRVYDLMKKGNIKQIITKYYKTKSLDKNPFNPPVINKIVFGISSTMKFLHSIHFLHRNLKPTKIFLDDRFEPRIMLDIESIFIEGDEYFNESDRLFGNRVFLFVPYLNTSYNAPEISAGVDYSYQIDVYSYGIILYALFNPNKIPIRLKPNQRLKLQRPYNISDDIWYLINICSSEFPDQRPTFDYIVKYVVNNSFCLKNDEIESNLETIKSYQEKIEMFGVNI